jgi:hypothetical protein
MRRLSHDVKALQKQAWDQPCGVTEPGTNRRPTGGLTETGLGPTMRSAVAARRQS